MNKRSRVVHTGYVHFQPPDGQPFTVPMADGTWLESEDAVYQRVLRGPTPLDFGWNDRPSCVVVECKEGSGLLVCEGVAFHKLRLGGRMKFVPVEGAAYWVMGECKVVVTAFPR